MKKIVKGWVVVKPQKQEVYEHTFDWQKKLSISKFEKDKEKWNFYKKQYGFKSIKCELVVEF